MIMTNTFQNYQSFIGYRLHDIIIIDINILSHDIYIVYWTNFMYKFEAMKMNELQKMCLKNLRVKDLHNKINKCFKKNDTNQLESS